MIEYDYEIIRDEGDELVKFKPEKIPTKLDNLAYIEGPNTIGKSTLLHILALSFFGLKTKKIPLALINKMNNLLNSKHQKIKFKVNITDKDNKLKILSEKKDFEKNDITAYEIINGKKKPLSPEIFQSKYNLLYDIPINPTDRLKELAYEIKDLQIRYGNKVGELNAFIRRIVSEIRSSRDPSRLKDLNEQLKKLNEDNERLKRDIELVKSDLELLENSTYHKYYFHYDSLCQEKDKNIKEIEKLVKKTVKQKIGEEQEYKTNIVWAQARINEMQKIFNQVTGLLNKLIPSKQKHHLKVWERINLYDALKDFEFNFNLREEIDIFKKILTSLVNTKCKEKVFQEISLYTELKTVLENYKTLNIVIPGVKKTITDFINELDEFIKKNQQLTIFSNNINTAIKLLETLDEAAKDVEENQLSKLKTLRKGKPIEISQNVLKNEEKLRLEEELKYLKNKKEFYETEYIKKGKPPYDKICPLGEGKLERYSIYTEEQLIKEIKDLKEFILNKQALFDKNKFYIDRLSKEIQDLENKKPHKLQNYLEELNKLMEITNILSARLLNEFNDYITDITKSRTDHFKSVTEEQTKYNDTVFYYLAKRLGSIRHGKNEYEVDKIDLIKEIVITKKGKIIHFTDMGTGQGQSAYLLGLLNTADKRKVIALFDEVAAMDDNSLKPIFEKFRELYNKKLLILGIVVQRGKEVKVISKLKE
jgi:exonuclease SbcC